MKWELEEGEQGDQLPIIWGVKSCLGDMPRPRSLLVYQQCPQKTLSPSLPTVVLAECLPTHQKTSPSLTCSCVTRLWPVWCGQSDMCNFWITLLKRRVLFTLPFFPWAGKQLYSIMQTWLSLLECQNTTIRVLGLWDNQAALWTLGCYLHHHVKEKWMILFKLLYFEVS